ncbi:thioredoxin-like protein [Ramaria rubella]|nr:thioredoxin-like protein [Ramaria rubella]
MSSTTTTTTLATPTPSASRTITVAVVCDIVCPWCYIGAKEIDKAIARLALPAKSPVSVVLEHKPFLLNPAWDDDEAKTKSEYLINKYGRERWVKVQEVLRERGKELGINFKSDGIACSTRRAHRLLLLAWNKGGADVQNKLLHTLYVAAFERGENMADIDLLAGYAAQVGFITKCEAVAFLKSDELKEDVERMIGCAQRNGVSGVPFTVINGRWAISGGQSSDVYFEILQKLVEGKEP